MGQKTRYSLIKNSLYRYFISSEMWTYIVFERWVEVWHCVISHRPSLCGVSWLRGDPRMQCAFEMQGKSAALKEKPTEQIEKKKTNFSTCDILLWCGFSRRDKPDQDCMTPVPPVILCASLCRLETSKQRPRSPGLRIVTRFRRTMRRHRKSALKTRCWPSILPRSEVDVGHERCNGGAF